MQLHGFIGKAKASIDAKGRVSFPKELRQYLADQNDGRVVVTLGAQKSLTLYPLVEWNEFVGELSRRPRTPENERFRIRITSSAKESVLDQQSRITLTAEQMQYAGINGEATFAADGMTVRIWQPERYSELYEQEIEGFDDMFYWDEPKGNAP
jgi:division/cell wall cluster transcriptional repressor MraZ